MFDCYDWLYASVIATRWPQAALMAAVIVCE